MFPGQQADGIMGMGTGDLSIMPALWRAGKLDQYVFSMCLAWEGGALTLGAVDNRMHHSETKWTPLSLDSFYSVGVTSFALVGGTGVDPDAVDAVVSIDLPSEGFRRPHTIVDSGTTFTYVPAGSFTALKAAIHTYCNGGNTPAGGRRCAGTPTTIPREDMCFTASGPGVVSTYPGVVITLTGGVAITLPPSQLFISMGWDRCVRCPRHAMFSVVDEACFPPKSTHTHTNPHSTRTRRLQRRLLPRRL